MSNYNLYETVVGLEVHAQLLTKSKLFCGDSTSFGAPPNTHVSPITLAHPGTLPKMNKKAIEYAVKMGLACNCTIEKNNYFARKNYFYPDLPKGYQVSQHTTPICKGGHIVIRINNEEKIIRLNRIHLEEDAGKSIHDADPLYTSVDFNRAGVPLIEIVTEPDIRSGDEAFAYVNEIRKLVSYLQICDGNMEEGSLRCDANISVRKKGETMLGTKVEIKNLNSVRNIKRAIEQEAKLMIDLIEAGEKIIQQTKSFDAASGKTSTAREKEDADDYRYFADPDLTPFLLTDDFIESIRKQIPALQNERIKKYTSLYHLSYYDASVLTDEKELADYFEQVITNTDNYKAAANWILGPVKYWMNERHSGIIDFPVPAKKLALLINLVEEGKVNFSAASAKIFPVLVENPAAVPAQVAADLNLLQQSDASAIEIIIDEVLARLPEKVKEFQKGKKGLMGLFVGEVMKVSNGKADPKITNHLLAEKLKSH
jgi:aspartyl-tRNA(Asn)/glutamyl-tRNA(Gln) amidotransferase subunit B